MTKKVMKRTSNGRALSFYANPHVKGYICTSTFQEFMCVSDIFS